MLQVDLLIVLQRRVGGEKSGARDGDDGSGDDGRRWVDSRKKGSDKRCRRKVGRGGKGKGNEVK